MSELPIPAEAIEPIALALRRGHPHDGSDQDEAVDYEAENVLRESLEAMGVQVEEKPGSLPQRYCDGKRRLVTAWRPHVYGEQEGCHGPPLQG